MKKIIALLLTVFFFCTFQAQSQTKPSDISENFCLIHTACSTLKEACRTANFINSIGAQISVIGTPDYFIGWVSPDKFPELTGKNNIISITNTLYSPEKSAVTGNDEMVIINYYNSVISKEYLNDDKLSADMSMLNNDCFFHSNEENNNLKGMVKGSEEVLSHSYCDNTATSEYMKGTIACGVFFTESDGSVDADTYTWTTTNENTVKTQVVKAFNYWSYTGAQNSVSITFTPVYYDHTTPSIVNQPYEPITHASVSDYLWIEAIMEHLGFTTGGRDDKVYAYNNYLRDSLGVDNTYSTFFTYNPSPASTQYTDGYSAYSWHGGPYCTQLFRDSWGTSNIYRVFGHESGHVFHAFDEYASSYDNCNYSFNGIFNSNFHASPCNGNSACLMFDLSYSGSGFTVCQYTRAFLGWTSDLTPAPDLTSPADYSTAGNNNIAFTWNRNTTNTSIYSYLIITNVTTGEVYCQSTTSDNVSVFSLAPGDYTWTVVNGNENEFNGYAMVPAGEKRHITLVAIGPHPDLIIENQTVGPATVSAGSVVLASCTVKNQGDSLGGSSILKYFLSDNTTYNPGDPELGSETVSSLAIGATSPQNEVLTIPSGTAEATWYILFFADATEQVTESNEGNNVQYFQITVDNSATVNCSSTISNFPYNEGFESGLGAWEQNIDDDCDWTRYCYPTPSNYTGPDNAHGGSYYLYTEASDCYNNKVLILTSSSCFDFTSYSSPQLSFWYHMYSQIYPEEMGTLEVQVSLDGGTNWSVPIWTRSFDQGQYWLNANIDLTLYTSATTKIRFKGTTGSGTGSDIAIDDINISGTTNISDMYNSRQMIKIYPNPAYNNLFVQFSEKTDNVDIAIYNVLGEAVQNIDKNSDVSDSYIIDISSFARGIYYLRIQSDGFSMVKEFIIIR